MRTTISQVANAKTRESKKTMMGKMRFFFNPDFIRRSFNKVAFSNQSDLRKLLFISEFNLNVLVLHGVPSAIHIDFSRMSKTNEDSVLPASHARRHSYRREPRRRFRCGCSGSPLFLWA